MPMFWTRSLSARARNSARGAAAASARCRGCRRTGFGSRTGATPISSVEPGSTSWTPTVFRHRSARGQRRVSGRIIQPQGSTAPALPRKPPAEGQEGGGQGGLQGIAAEEREDAFLGRCRRTEEESEPAGAEGIDDQAADGHGGQSAGGGAVPAALGEETHGQRGQGEGDQVAA